MKYTLICSVLFFLLVGCGQKGALYLPSSADVNKEAKTTQHSANIK